MSEALRSHSVSQTRGALAAVLGNPWLKTSPFGARHAPIAKHKAHLAAKRGKGNMPTKNEILAVRALRNRKTRLDERKFVVEGFKGVEEAMASGWLMHGLHATADSNVPEAWGASRVSSKEMARMSTLKNPPGILAVMGMPEPEGDPLDTEELSDFSLAIDGLSDPGNLGTIIRTADWFGVAGIWVSHDTVDPFNPKVVQATMGAIFRVSIRSVDLAPTLKEWSAKGVGI